MHLTPIRSLLERPPSPLPSHPTQSTSTSSSSSIHPQIPPQQILSPQVPIPEQVGEVKHITFQVVSSWSAFRDLVMEVTDEPNQHPIISLEHFLKERCDILRHMLVEKMKKIENLRFSVLVNVQYTHPTPGMFIDVDKIT